MLEIKRVKAPDGKTHRLHAVPRDGQTLWLDRTDASGKRSNDSGLLYREENGQFVYDHCERIDALRKKGEL